MSWTCKKRSKGEKKVGNPCPLQPPQDVLEPLFFLSVSLSLSPYISGKSHCFLSVLRQKMKVKATSSGLDVPSQRRSKRWKFVLVTRTFGFFFSFFISAPLPLSLATFWPNEQYIGRKWVVVHLVQYYYLLLLLLSLPICPQCHLFFGGGGEGTSFHHRPVEANSLETILSTRLRGQRELGGRRMGDGIPQRKNTLSKRERERELWVQSEESFFM